MATRVACLMNPAVRRSRDFAMAMAVGIEAFGDVAVPSDVQRPAAADFAVMYGWKFNALLRRYPGFLYGDLGYWNRDGAFRLAVNGWSPEEYVKATLPATRLAEFGITPYPWRSGGDYALLLGASRKSMREHGYDYMEWERKTAKALNALGIRVRYRPKPTDRERRPIDGIEYDAGAPMAEAFSGARIVVAHHSNGCVDALVAGVPVHCETGAAAAFSVPLHEAGDPPKLPGRDQFLADVARLEWSVADIRSGDAWNHLKGRGLV